MYNGKTNLLFCRAFHFSPLSAYHFILQMNVNVSISLFLHQMSNPSLSRHAAAMFM